MIYVTGDMHGDPERLSDPALRRLKKGDILLVCGDFGFVWDGSAAEQKLLRRISRQKYTMAFLDGRHENYDLLAAYPTETWHGGQAQILNERLVHLMRGEIYELEGRTFFTFGGGESTDKDMRLESGNWWRNEEPTPMEMAEGAKRLDEAGLHVDYIITHEPPSLVKSAILRRRGDADRVNKLNGYLEEIGRSCDFGHWYFGSLH